MGFKNVHFRRLFLMYILDAHFWRLFLDFLNGHWLPEFKNGVY